MKRTVSSCPIAKPCVPRGFSDRAPRGLIWLVEAPRSHHRLHEVVSVHAQEADLHAGPNLRQRIEHDPSDIRASSSKLKTGSACPAPSRSTVSRSGRPNPSFTSFTSFAITQYLCVPARRGTPPAVSSPSRVEAPSTPAALMQLLRSEGRGLFGSRLQPYIDHTPSPALKSTQIHSNTPNHVK